jgi:hypothetical protein
MDDQQTNDPIEDMLDTGDWALIFDNEGNLKGLFIPEGQDEEFVPENIVRIMEDFFGIDLSEDSVTLH